MIHITCDICGKEPTDKDFVFEANWIEIRTSLLGESLTPNRQKETKLIQICKGCFYKHIHKLLNERTDGK